MGDVRDPREVLAAAVAPAGRDVVDVGSGDGGLARWLAGRGARGGGVAVGAEPLARARAADPVAGERYVEGVAQDLPLGDASADVVVFMQSLHHVPGASLGAALDEAARVLRPGGVVYVQEPLAEGPLFEVLRLVDDETGVRAAAAEALERASEHGLARRERLWFDVAVRLSG
ncbi:MAG TPA: class I SAM-dependent methyltransferase, partial [Solirubrobacteraceae bacterium]